MLKHMVNSVKHSKKCLPYSCFLTKLFSHFQIPLDNEGSIQIIDSIDSNYLKGAHITLLKGKFIRVIPEIPNPTTPPSLHPSLEILNLLRTIANNQATITADIKDIQLRLSMLEKGKLPIRQNDLHSMFRNVEDEFINLQAGFDLHTRAMVEALQRKMNCNACQLSTKLKFFSNQIGTLGHFTERRMNDLSEELQADQVQARIPEWPQCNWMAEYQCDFLDLPLPPPTFIARPPRFANTLSLEENEHRRLHRPYFNAREANHVYIDDEDY